jgi:uncharacterized protein
MIPREPCQRCRTTFALLCLFVLASSTPAAEIPFLSSRVNDTAGILSSSTIRELEQMLKRHEDSTSNQVAVLTVRSLEGVSLEQYSIRVVDAWKLGKKGKDNGVLLLVVSEDRNIRIEVGRGLEGDLPDITCGIIIRKEILPYFKKGDFNGGVQAGITAILSAIGGAYTAQSDQGVEGDTFAVILGTAIFVIVVGLFTLLAMFMRGPMTWIMYVFLMPFWFAFPSAMYGLSAGIALFGLYAVGFLVVKTWFGRSLAGKAFQESWAKRTGTWTTGTGGWSSGGGGWSSGGGFSGGGGGFSGGGASGSW